jgi:hypothetical protein
MERETMKFGNLGIQGKGEPRGRFPRKRVVVERNAPEKLLSVLIIGKV